jgi:hypothetical protein
MKLLKHLKKITYFDIGVGIIVIILAFSGYLFFKRDVQYITIRVKITDREILYANTQPADWYANRFVVGDSEKDALGRTITEIVGVENYSVGTNKKALYIDMKIKAVYDKRTKTYSARGKTVAFGTPMRFYLSKVIFDGIVTEFPESTQLYKITTTTVTVLARGLEPSVAEKIKTGDKILDSNGTTLAEIIELEATPAERVTTTVGGDLLLRFDPLYKDVHMKISMRTKILEQDFYVLDNIPLKVGVSLPLSLNNVSLDTTGPYGFSSPVIVDFTLPEQEITP